MAGGGAEGGRIGMCIGAVVVCPGGGGGGIGAVDVLGFGWRTVPGGGGGA